ncbi:hypothetical protein EX30DRAFT_347330 [Ascodesmis nigricans]|uniref:Uncharacterized protein n=1 Tax=Ascodesmis nigricans TaxID=341454 RepID=A0A4S2N1J0_9PEZI|nr:hypothetical protein EX30DRAFT_347330 [Ascodesmis nigricans]
MSPTTYFHKLGHDIDNSWQHDNWDDDDWRENTWQADTWSSSPSSPSSSSTSSRSSSCDRPDPQHFDPDFEMPVPYLPPLPPSQEEEEAPPLVPSQTQEPTQPASVWNKVRRILTSEEVKFIWLPALALFLALSAVLFIPGRAGAVKSPSVQDDEPKSVSSSTSVVTIWMMQWKTETVAVSETVTVSTTALETVYSTMTEAPEPTSVVEKSKAGDTALEHIIRVESIMEKLNWATKSGQTPSSTTLPKPQDHRPLIRQNHTTLSALHHRQRSQSPPSIALNNPFKAISTAMWAEVRTLVCPIFPTFGPCRRYAAAVEEQLLKIEWELRKQDLWDWLKTRKEDCIDWLAHNKNVPCPNTEGTTWEEVCEDEEGLGDNDGKRVEDEEAEETNGQDTETGGGEIYKDEL